MHALKSVAERDRQRDKQYESRTTVPNQPNKLSTGNLHQHQHQHQHLHGTHKSTHTPTHTHTMAVPFHLPEGGSDDIASSSAGTSGAHSSSASSSSSSSASSSGASTSSGASDGASSIASQSPNTTTSATQTPMQSPLTMPTDQVLIALCEWYQQHQRQYNYNVSTTGEYISPPPLVSQVLSQSQCQSPPVAVLVQVAAPEMGQFMQR